MKQTCKSVLVAIAFSLAALGASGTEVVIPITGSDPMERHDVKFQCDEHAAGIGLPTGVFPVQYINGNGNSLAVLPINKRSLIFSNVLSASGSRYAAGVFIWWDAGNRGVHLYSDSLSGKNQTSCHQVKE